MKLKPRSTYTTTSPAPLTPAPGEPGVRTRAYKAYAPTWEPGAVFITLLMATGLLWLSGCSGLLPAPEPLEENESPAMGLAELETVNTISGEGREGLSTLFAQPASAALHFSEPFLNGLARDLLSTDTTVANILVTIPESHIPVPPAQDPDDPDPEEALQLHIMQSRWSVPVLKVRLQIAEDESGEEHMVLTTTPDALQASIRVALTIGGDTPGEEQEELAQCRLNVALDETQFTNRLFLKISEGSNQFFHAKGGAEHPPLHLELDPAPGCQFRETLEDSLDSISTVLIRAMEFSTQVHAGRIGYVLSKTIYNPRQVDGAWLPMAEDYTGDTSHCGAVTRAGGLDPETRPTQGSQDQTAGDWDTNCNNSPHSVPEPQSMLLLKLEPTWTYARNPSATWIKENGAGMLLDVQTGIWRSREQAPTPASIHTQRPARQARAINPLFPALDPEGLRYQVGIALSDQLIKNTVSYALQAGFLCTPAALRLEQQTGNLPPVSGKTAGAGHTCPMEEANQLISSVLPFNLATQGDSSPFMRISSAMVREMDITGFTTAGQQTLWGTPKTREPRPSGHRPHPGAKDNPADHVPINSPELRVELDDALLEIIVPLEESQIRVAWAKAHLTLGLVVELDKKSSLINLNLHSLQMDDQGQVYSNLITDEDSLAALSENRELLYRAVLDKVIRRNLAWALPQVATHPLVPSSISRENGHVIFYLRDP